MGFIVRFLIFIAACIVGTLMMKYREKIVRTVGKNDYAERFLGSGGSYNLWILIGVLIIIAALVYLAG